MKVKVEERERENETVKLLIFSRTLYMFDVCQSIYIFTQQFATTVGNDFFIGSIGKEELWEKFIENDNDD